MVIFGEIVKQPVPINKLIILIPSLQKYMPPGGVSSELCHNISAYHHNEKFNQILTESTNNYLAA